MSATITWQIEWMNTTPTTSTPPETVITAGWRCNGVQVEGSGDTAKTYNATIYSTCSFPAPTETFTPYADLTQAQVLGWCYANGVDQTTTEAAIQANIDNQINPPIIQPPLPWATPTPEREAATRPWQHFKGNIMGKNEQIPIDCELVRTLFNYQDGSLVWKVNRGTAVEGDKAHSNGNGYLAIKLFGRPYLEHRLIWLWHGNELDGDIDHIDGNPLNNKIENLRTASHSENMRNAKMRSDNKSGVKGVSWCKTKRKWKVQLWFGSRQQYLGRYDSLDIARQIVESARLKYHLNFANHGA